MIVLDTHVWVWWVSDPGQLSRKARATVDGAAAARAVYISSISVWEVAMLVAKGRLELAVDVEDWVRRSEVLAFFHFVPVDNHIALRSTRLPRALHDDPADRIIIATAIALGMPLVTKDKRIREYPQVESTW